MNKILLLTLVHPDFLPPVYSMAQVMSNKGYSVDILTFESSAPGSFAAGLNINTQIVTKHSGSAKERAKARNLFKLKLKEYLSENSPKAIFTYCEFSYLQSLQYYQHIPIFHFALELTDFKIKNIFTSPFGAIRTLMASKQLHKAYFISTPSTERSGWLAGRNNLKKIPETVHNTPYVPEDFTFLPEYCHLLPERFRDKTRILNTGGVNGTRSVLELIKGFEISNSNNCLIITNIGSTEYSQQIKNIVGQSKRKDDILLLGTVSRENLLSIQASSHIGICLMKLEDGFDARMIAPNKVGEYFLSGLLVLGIDTPYFHQFIPYKTTQLISDLQPDTIAKGLDTLSLQIKHSNYRDDILLCLKEWYNMETQMKLALSSLQTI